MAYYGNYSYQQQQQQPSMYNPYSSVNNTNYSYCSPALASQSGYAAPAALQSSMGYAQQQPHQQYSRTNYYHGPSYSTASGNALTQLPVAGYGMVNSGYSSGGYDQNCSYTPQQQQQQQQQQAQLAKTMSSFGSPSPQQEVGSVDADVTQLAPQIEAAYEQSLGQRRQPVVKRQVITMPGQPGKVQQVVRRLSTPVPDVVERVFIVKPERDVVNLVIERPGTPPAQFKDRTIYGKPRRPLINPRIVRVAPRSLYGQYQLSQYQSDAQYMHALPAPSNLQYHPQMSQAQLSQTGGQSNMSQTQLSQASQSQLGTTVGQQQVSQANLSQAQLSQGNLSQAQIQQERTVSANAYDPTRKQRRNGYVIAPIQYEQQQQQQQMIPMAGYSTIGGYGLQHASLANQSYGCRF